MQLDERLKCDGDITGFHPNSGVLDFDADSACFGKSTNRYASAG
jgi:hypothetical protein